MNPTKKRTISIISLLALAIVIFVSVAAISAWSNSKNVVEMKFNEAIEEKLYGKALKYTNVKSNQFINAKEFKSFYEERKDEINLVPVYEGKKVFFMFKKYSIDLKDYTQDLSVILPSESTLSFNGVRIIPYKDNKGSFTDTFYIGRVLMKPYDVKITNPLTNDFESTITIGNESKLTADKIGLEIKDDYIKDIKETATRAITNFYLCVCDYTKEFEDLSIAQNYSTEDENILQDNFYSVQNKFFDYGAGNHYSTSDFKIKMLEVKDTVNLVSANKCRLYADLDYISSMHYNNINGEEYENLNSNTSVELIIEMIRVKNNWEVYSITEACTK